MAREQLAVGRAAVLRGVFTQAPAAVAIVRGREHVFELANPFTEDLLGARDLVGRSARAIGSAVAQGYVGLFDRVYETSESLSVRGRSATLPHAGDGHRMEGFVSLVLQPLHEDGVTDGVVMFAFDVTEQVEARKRAEALADELRARELDLEAYARRITLLAEASKVLSDPRDVDTMLADICGLVVTSSPENLAEGCSAHLVDDEGMVRRAAVANRTGEIEPAGEAWSHRSPYVDPDTAHGRTLATGAARVDVDEAEGSTLLSVPLSVHGRTFGALTMWRALAAGVYADADLHLAEEIGRRVAIAIDHYWLFDLAKKERARAEEANRAKDEFLAMVSHELRTPLNAMLGWARMLRSGALDQEKQVKALDVIERNAKAQTQLIEDLLDVSRIITGKLRLEVDTVDLPRVVAAAVETLRPLADSRGVRLESDVDPSGGPIVGDASRLQQVVWNLVNNAVKFTPKEGRVAVRLTKSDSHVEIHVEDSGQGISHDFLPHVFERFRQAEKGLTRQRGGLGLGLAIVQHIVELHGGEVTAHSDGEGRGATFFVRLPIAPLRAPPSSRGSMVPPLRLDGSGSTERIAGLKVIVVDDEDDARDLLCSVLERCGAIVKSASSAREAFALLEAWLPDVLVSDIGMPREDGYSLLQKVRRLPADRGGTVPAVALTAYARMEDRTRALLAGFNMHVPKPVDPGELLVVLATLTGRLSHAETVDRTP